MAIQQSTPTYKQVSVNGAVFLDQGVVERFIALAEKHISSPVSVLYSLKTRDGYSSDTEEMADLGRLNFHHLRTREHFTIRVASNITSMSWPSASLEFSFLNYGNPASINIHNIDNLLEFEREAKDFLEHIRPWYNWIYRAHLLIPWLLGSAFLGLLFGDLYPRRVHPASPIIILGTILPLLYVAFVMCSRRWLFDRVEVSFGEEGKRQARLVAARRVIFGVLLLALFVSVLNGFFSGYFTRVFAHS